MDYINPLLLILGGVLAAASLIVAKKPDAKAMIDKLAPYQATIGVALLVFGVWNLIRMVTQHFFSFMSVIPVLSVVALAVVACSILLGIMFGMPMVAKLSAEGAAKGEEMAKKMAPYHVLIGIVGIVSGLVYIIFRLGILKPM